MSQRATARLPRGARGNGLHASGVVELGSRTRSMSDHPAIVLASDQRKTNVDPLGGTSAQSGRGLEATDRSALGDVVLQRDAGARCSSTGWIHSVWRLQ